MPGTGLALRGPTPTFKGANRPMTIDDLLDAIDHSRMVPDSEHLNAVDNMALGLFAQGLLSMDQVRNASTLARQTEAI